MTPATQPAAPPAHSGFLIDSLKSRHTSYWLAFITPPPLILTSMLPLGEQGMAGNVQLWSCSMKPSFRDVTWQGLDLTRVLSKQRCRSICAVLSSIRLTHAMHASLYPWDIQSSVFRYLTCMLWIIASIFISTPCRIKDLVFPLGGGVTSLLFGDPFW